MVLVFKTSVRNKAEIKKVATLLNELSAPAGMWNFDLDDCDKILRMEGSPVSARLVENALQKKGFLCRELDT